MKEYILVKTEYSWNGMLELPGWCAWEKSLLEESKKLVKQYFEGNSGNKAFFVPIGGDNSIEIRTYNDVFGPWCYQVEYTITEEEFNTLNKLFTGYFGRINYTKITKELFIKMREDSDNQF